jgi:hypothetical protein
MVCIDTLEVKPPCPISDIELSYVNYAWMLICALRPLMPWWKETIICPPIGFTISGHYLCHASSYYLYCHTYQTST